MSKKNLFKKLALAGLVCATAVTATSCKKDDVEAVKTYTYKTAAGALGTNWNPHTWEMSADNTMLSYLTSGFVDMSILSTENSTYQWVYDMATSITDVTNNHQDYLTKYECNLPEGQTASTVNEGYVYEIKLRQGAKWENGDPINADSYIYSMKQNLNSKMKNYRANTYWSGDTEIAGGREYYNSGAPVYSNVVEYDGETPVVADLAGKEIYVGISQETTLFGSSFTLKGLVEKYCADNEAAVAAIKKLEKNKNAYGYTKVSGVDDADLVTVIKAVLPLWEYDAEDAQLVSDWCNEAAFYYDGIGEEVSFDKVGLVKVDDYTLRYVNKNAVELPYFYTAMISMWLVHEETYERCKDTTGELVTSTYGTSKETTMSYGPYKLAEYQANKQAKFVQNENWFGYKKDENGNLYSETEFEVDGKHVTQYQAQTIVIDVMESATQENAFLKGEIDVWAPEGDKLPQYTGSDRLLQVDETYTMRLFFHTNLDSLKKMDAEKGNQNSVVMSNAKFREAFSLSIDRAEWVTATEGYKPAYSLINSLYHYDIYNDPASKFRNTDAAMQAICDVYGVKWGAGEAYPTLKDAYKSITGKDITTAKRLMKEACEELIADGLYTANSPIKIKIGWKAGAMSENDNKQCSLLQKYINEVLGDSQFGAITFEAVGNLAQRYQDVANGEYCIGYGAWGGAAFYPYKFMEVFMDQDDIHEAGCWDPRTESLTINVNGEEVTLTYQKWAKSMVGTGQFANESFDTKNYILSQLEKAFIEKYYCIPLASTTAVELTSYKVDYYTNEYNIMYGFGGVRLMTFNYSDAEWADYIANNTLDYKN